MVKKDKVQKELEGITATIGYRAGTLKVLIQIRNKLDELLKKYDNL